MAATTGRKVGGKHQTVSLLATSLGVAITRLFTVIKAVTNQFSIGIKKKAETKPTPIFTQIMEP